MIEATLATQTFLLQDEKFGNIEGHARDALTAASWLYNNTYHTQHWSRAVQHRSTSTHADLAGFNSSQALGQMIQDNCTISNLRVLWLGFSNLEVLPAEVTLLTNLDELFLQCNQLTALPVDLMKLSGTLHTLDLI